MKHASDREGRTRAAPPCPADSVRPHGRLAALLVSILRFLGLWAGISGAYLTAGGTCPCCGQPGCPVGIGAAAILGALGSFLVLKGRRLIGRLFRKPSH